MIARINVLLEQCAGAETTWAIQAAKSETLLTCMLPKVALKSEMEREH